MPIEAQVSPLPRELTTPPVTKMCLAIAGCSSVGARCASFYQFGGKLATVLRRVATATLAVKTHEAIVIGARIDAEAGVGDDPHLDLPPQRQHSQLFQFFQLFQRFRRYRGELHEEVAPIGIQSQVQQE